MIIAAVAAALDLAEGVVVICVLIAVRSAEQDLRPTLPGKLAGGRSPRLLAPVHHASLHGSTISLHQSRE